MRPSRESATPDGRRGPARYTFVGGKGGVGKTTCAAAESLRAARSGGRTLVVSTDPAPSLADAFRQPLGPTPRPVRGVPRLHAMELDAAGALERWLAERRATLEAIALHGTWLDREDIGSLLRLSLPGVDEVAALLEIVRIGGDARYDRIVVDTAPTGHLLRMLRTPAVLGRLARVFGAMQEKRRTVARALGGRLADEAGDVLIDELSNQARGLTALLRDPGAVALTWVTLPEAMAVEETLDALRVLGEESVPVRAVLVNRLLPAPPQRCRWCERRRALQGEALARLARSQSGRIPLRGLPEWPDEPRGLAALDAVARALATPFRRPPRRAADGPPIIAARPVAVGEAAGVPPLIGDGTRLLMFGGKGGVGKTTCAAAEALAISERGRPPKRVLLLSTDPAHSVGDALGAAFSDRPRRFGRLLVRELDAERVFDRMRQGLAAAAEAFLSPPGQGIDFTHDRQTIRELLELAPPGIDELAAVLDALDAIARPTTESSSAGRIPYDLVVMDTAPSGHALRLLEMPSLVHAWVKALMQILLKYRGVVRLGGLGDELLRLSKGLTGMRELLRDPVRTRFVAVTRPGALPRAETARLRARLAVLGIPVAAIVVNAAGAGTCARCRTSRAAQAREVRALRARLARERTRPPTLVLAPAEVPAPHGAGPLHTWRARWSALPRCGGVGPPRGE